MLPQTTTSKSNSEFNKHLPNRHHKTSAEVESDAGLAYQTTLDCKEVHYIFPPQTPACYDNNEELLGGENIRG